MKRASVKTHLAALVGFLLTLFLIGSMAQGQVPAEVLEHGYADMVLLKEYHEKRLPGARSIPLAELHKRLREVPRVGRVILYCGCRTGDDAYANFFLRDNGYRNIAVLEEGFSGWVKRKYPVEAGR